MYNKLVIVDKLTLRTSNNCTVATSGLLIMTIKMSTGESYLVLLKTHAKVVFWLNGNVMSVNNATR